jgi:hypothetical protein
MLTKRALWARTPIWVRVPAIIALVLGAVLIGTTLMGAAGVGDDGGRSGGHGRSESETQLSDHNRGRSRDETQMQNQNRDRAEGHGSDDQGHMRNRDEGRTGPGGQ